MTTTDKLGYSRRPEIEQPLDMGDGPFLSAAPAADALAAQPAAVDSVFRRERPFREAWATSDEVERVDDMILTRELKVKLLSR